MTPPGQARPARRAAARLVTPAIALGLVVLLALPLPGLAQEVGDTARVDTLRLNLRSGPGTENGVVRDMPEGTRLRIIARREGWAEVELEEPEGVTGWTSARYLEVLTRPAPGSPGAFFRQAKAVNGPPDETGYLPTLDTHYTAYCRSATGVGLALFRPAEPQPVLWEKQEWCVRDVRELDIDRDGTPEVVYHNMGGGTGTFTVIEKILHWPTDSAAPRLGFQFTALQVDQVFAPSVEIALVLKSVREMRYGEQCRQEDYCPDWPPEAQCREVIACALTEVKEMRVSAPVFPERLRGDPAWADYVKMRAEEGFVLVGDDAVESLDTLELGDLAQSDDGSRPELTEERKALVSEWLD